MESALIFKPRLWFVLPDYHCSNLGSHIFTNGFRFLLFFFFIVAQESSSSGENGEANTLRHYNLKTKQNLSQSVCFLLLNILQQLLLSLLRPFKLFYFPTCSWLHLCLFHLFALNQPAVCGICVSQF